MGFFSKFPFFYQLDAMDCGPACLRMIIKHYGKSISLAELKERANLSREGVSIMDLADTADGLGFKTIPVKITFQKFITDGVFPSLVFVNQKHFAVVYKVGKSKVFVADPSVGYLKYSHEEFQKIWCSTEEIDKTEGIALMLEPSPKFYEDWDEEREDKKPNSLAYILRHLKNYKKLILQLCFAFVVSTLIQTLFPFLTQSIVDIGIATKDLGFLYLVLFAQLSLFLGRVFADFIRSWIILHVGARINITILSDFLSKMMRLPLSYFDSRMLGDTMQRIEDHNRIERFLSASTIGIVFSMLNLIVFSAILAVYSTKVFLYFFVFSCGYICYLLLFLKQRKVLDYKRFARLAQNQSSLYQIVTSMPEIKLNSGEKEKRMEWERIQFKLFNISISSLKLYQYQESGGMFLNELKNIIIIYITATAVMSGQMTLGMMISVQYIIGVLNMPIVEFTNFLREYQDARLSLERIQEVQLLKDEEQSSGMIKDSIPANSNIFVEDLKFRYGGPRSPLVFSSLGLTIPYGKVTAIVGASGCGKSTLMKLILKFYPPCEGKIILGNINMSNISSSEWRKRCGVVLQDGTIFSDSILKNIAVGDPHPDLGKINRAIEIANIGDLIETLPSGLKTMVGNSGVGLSHGQRQRLLIARAIYKDPEYIFFDEATSSLDSKNERVIVENLQSFFKNRTVVIIAHRLSTVKNADQLIVLDKGSAVEIGSHAGLIGKRGAYYQLIKNQLELGN